MSEVTNTYPICPALIVVIQDYEDLFREPTGLLPKRDCDHAIYLQDNTNIPNIRPYRYPYYQKFEIENFVQEMMGAGVIQPNTIVEGPILKDVRGLQGFLGLTRYY